MASRSETGRKLAGSALANARAVAPVLRAEAERIEAARALTAEALAAMHDGQLFRLSLPRRHGNYRCRNWHKRPKSSPVPMRPPPGAWARPWAVP